MNKTLLSAALAALACTTFLPTARAADDAPALTRVAWSTVEGSGQARTESRAIGGFQAIALRGPMDLVLRQGTREGVELRGDDNILPLVETRVVDRQGVPTLEIGTRDGADFSTRTRLVLTIDLKTLSALAVSGSGDVSGDGLKTPALRVSLSGSGDLRLMRLDTETLTTRIAGSGDMRVAGRAPHAAFSIAGSGDVDAAALEGDDVSVDIAGSGDAKVTAHRTLTVSIAGSGGVTYGGDPTVKSRVAGSGTVQRR